MARYTIAVLPGDGIGPEITEEGIKVLYAAEEAFPGLKMDFTTYEASATLYARTGVALPPDVYDACAQADAIFFGSMGLPDIKLPDGTEVAGEVIFRLRFGLDLYAGVRPITLYPNVQFPLKAREPGSIDYVIIRENVEGLYASRGGGTLLRDEVATDTIVMTRKGTERIVRYAFELAKRRNGAPLDGIRRVTCVDKSNVLRSYAFFRKVYDDVAAEYPNIERDYAYVDAMTLWQVQRPEFYDVVVAENMFGDIISDLGAGTVGSMGMAPSGDIGDEHGLFQPAHGTAPTIAGKGIANPLAMILSGSMMLEWLGIRHDDRTALDAAKRINAAVKAVLAKEKLLPQDVGGTAGTKALGDAVAARVVSGVEA
ncbi:isocitrate/isopropylmalate dehydrogenase family protein [candidate division KSB3 bacterium]|uniref:3-isopropylmalate dehydrogenase n=1 Tax=candidate division KSB3 bacterium TaxID=2044937 RepID=A0A9D5JTH9_9BACT|nr:isocitrate/isopropylmalate dehydrogenase family protein [candidate division KSB3 bacterium]MBD3323809.1 isocitrate/isopropylmalate dehydrogenase family protein [candidate division KSB3 bacterium]